MSTANDTTSIHIIYMSPPHAGYDNKWPVPQVLHLSVRHGLGWPMGHGLGRQWVWGGLEFFRKEWALDGPGLEFGNCVNNAAGEIIYIKPNLIVLLHTREKTPSFNHN